MSKPILEIQNLSFQFGSNVVLKNLNFKINKNENWQIGGPSGTGKTTLAKIISGEIKNFEGNIKINFDENSDWKLTPKAKELCERIFQHIEKCNR